MSAVSFFRLVASVGFAWLLLPAAGRAAEPAAGVACEFGGTTYRLRWAERGQHEFTPDGQEDLARWTDMVTVNVHPAVAEEQALAELANRVLGNYRAAHAGIVRTDSVPRTAARPAEHFIAVVFVQAESAEVAFARVRLVDGTGCVIVHSHRLYGAEARRRTGAWLKEHGTAAERRLMAWEDFPRPAALAAATAGGKH